MTGKRDRYARLDVDGGIVLSSSDGESFRLVVDQNGRLVAEGPL